MHVFIRAFAVLGFAMMSAIAIPAAPFAAAYPDRPLRLIVPSLAGGGTDTTTRIIAPKLAEYLGQQIVIDNRGGMSGIWERNSRRVPHPMAIRCLPPSRRTPAIRR